MTVNTLSQEVSTFKNFQSQKPTSYPYMKKQCMCARHLQFVAHKMAEIYSFQIYIYIFKQGPGYKLSLVFPIQKIAILLGKWV